VVVFIRFAIAFALAFAFAFALAFAFAFAFALALAFAFALAFFDVLFLGVFGLLGGEGVKRTLCRILFADGRFNAGLR